jgi:RNA polymerase sigma factor (sigma-70 family)
MERRNRGTKTRFLSRPAKGGTNMKPKDHEAYTRQTFDSFCKKVLKYTARDCRRAMKRRAEHETPLSELSASELTKLIAVDEYFRDEYVFNVLGESVGVTNHELAEALSELTADRRDIVLMSYFFDMTDKEIAGHLNLARRTIAYRRTSTLKTLKNLLEKED